MSRSRATLRQLFQIKTRIKSLESSLNFYNGHKRRAGNFITATTETVFEAVLINFATLSLATSTKLNCEDFFQ
jgi:hypothetical protein